MPANPKYLNKSPWHQFAKLFSGILGGFVLSCLIHLTIAYYSDYKVVISTSIYSIFILWCVLLIIPYLFNNGWKPFLLYILMILVFGTLVYFGKSNFSLV